MTRLVSTLPFHKSLRWSSSVETVSASSGSRPGVWRRVWARAGVPDPSVITRLLRRAAAADAVLINGGERADLVYLALAALCPWITAPHLIVDAHWQPGQTALHRWAQRLPLWLGRRLLAEVQPHSREEIPLYVSVFGLPEAVVKPLPWSTSLTGYDLQRQADPGEAIVTGGHSYRDYRTLLDAVRGESWPLRIGLPPSPVTAQVNAWAADLPNVEVVSDWTFRTYWQAVADSRVFAMAITPGLQRCTADQTICNAMALGAIVVATDAMSSRIYIEHGRTGFLVPEGDAAAWRRTLADVHALPPEKARAIRSAAQHEATTRFSEDARIEETLRRARVAAAEWAERGHAPGRHDAWQWAKAGFVLLLAAKASLLPILL
ncbi:glycosyltransferase [Silanimonas sp.]|uniref:glycosyltransferase n=1 Tax=Silanimonas sp. TaxID=1929290 RepID=UPI0037CBE5ED